MCNGGLSGDCLEVLCVYVCVCVCVCVCARTPACARASICTVCLILDCS